MVSSGCSTVSRLSSKYVRRPRLLYLFREVCRTCAFNVVRLIRNVSYFVKEEEPRILPLATPPQTSSLPGRSPKSRGARPLLSLRLCRTEGLGARAPAREPVGKEGG